MQLSVEEVVDRYYREFGAWKYYHFDQNFVPIDKPWRPLSPLVQSLIKGYIEHQDYDAALGVLQSAQYFESIVTLELFRALLSGYLKVNTDSVAEEIISYLCKGINSGQWDVLFEGIRTNLLQEEDAGGFWTILETMVESPTISAIQRDGISRLLLSIFWRLHSGNRLVTLVIEGLEARRLRRKFISTHLVGLMRIAAPEHLSPLIKIISLILMSLASDRGHYGEFLDELYVHCCSMETFLLLTLLQGLMPPVNIELILLILERKYRLSNTIERHIPLLPRTCRILSNLESMRVQDPSGTSRNLDPLIFRLVRILVVGMIVFYRVQIKDKLTLFINPGELLQMVRRLAFNVEWPVNILMTMRTTVRCIERFCPDQTVIIH